MFLFAITISALLGPALTRPQEPASAPPAASASQSASTPIAIVSQTDEVNPDGSFKFSYETANGIKVEESGYLKDGNESSTDKIQVIEGSVSYTDNDGKVINLKYIADENGFQPEGDHLPTAPPLPGAAPNALRALPGQSGSTPAAQPTPQAPAKSAAQLAVPSTTPAAAQPAVPSTTPAAAQSAALSATQPAAQPVAQPTVQPEAQPEVTVATQTP